MKRTMLILLICLCAFFMGCKKDIEAAETSSAVLETTAVQQEVLTELELLDLFNGYTYADPANRVAVACEVVPDSAYGVLGVVQYTAEDHEGCSFDFIRDGRPLPVGIEALPTENDTLAYLGNDTVRVELRDDHGYSHTYTIAFADDGSGHNFEITSE